MTDVALLPTWRSTPTPAALAVLLHPVSGAASALRLARAWAPAVPAADVSTLLIPEGEGAEAAAVQLHHKLHRTGLDAARLVVAGVCGAEGTALQLAFGPDAFAVAGVLACGDVLLPLAPLAESPAGPRTRLRLVWTANDPLASAAALGALLRCFRATGIDAQGSVLGRESCLPGGIRDGSELPSALVRLGGAYLAELVAVALGAALSSSGHQGRPSLERTAVRVPDG